jgi:hypothetical protein
VTEGLATLEKGKMLRVEGVVYCLTHTCVHEDTLDPYDEGSKTCWEGMFGARTKAMVHRTVYYRARKGDIDEARYES